MTFWLWLMYPSPPPTKIWILSQLQLFTSFPIEVTQNDSEWPILHDLEWPILPDSQLFQSFPTKVAQNDLEWPILPDF